MYLTKIRKKCLWLSQAVKNLLTVKEQYKQQLMNSLQQLHTFRGHISLFFIAARIKLIVNVLHILYNILFLP